VNELSCLAGLARMPRDGELAIRGLRALRSKEVISLSDSCLVAHRRERGRMNRKDMCASESQNSEVMQARDILNAIFGYCQNPLLTWAKI
jgi:hypothetical protein